MEKRKHSPLKRTIIAMKKWIIHHTLIQYGTIKKVRKLMPMSLCTYTIFIKSDYTFQLTTAKKFLEELQSTLTPTNKDVLPCLKHINSLLYNAALTCTAATQSTTSQTAFKAEAENVAPGKKSEHQWRYHATSKAAGRKRKGLVVR